MDLTEKLISTNKIFDGKIISVKVDTIELPNKQTGYREVVTHSGGVCVVAIDDEQNIYMVRQFRYPYNQELLEIPAGKKEKEELPIVCGTRELTEEVGLVAEEMIFLGEVYPTPGYNNEVITMYLAKGLTQTNQNLDQDEFLNVEKYHIDELLEMINNNEIKDAKTQIAIMKTKLFMDI